MFFSTAHEERTYHEIRHKISIVIAEKKSILDLIVLVEYTQFHLQLQTSLLGTESISERVYKNKHGCSCSMAEPKKGYPSQIQAVNERE